MAVIRPDVVKAAGSLQWCAGEEDGAEASVHALRTLFERSSSEAVLLVDAKNSFDNFNREATLLNVNSVCPALVRILMNCYRTPSALYKSSGKVLWSCEGTTQGDPLGMAMYANVYGNYAPTHRLQDRNPTLQQVRFADNSAGMSDIAKLRRWWDDLQRFGPAFGYTVNPPKCWLIVKAHHYDSALKFSWVPECTCLLRETLPRCWFRD